MKAPGPIDRGPFATLTVRVHVTLCVVAVLTLVPPTSRAEDAPITVETMKSNLGVSLALQGGRFGSATGGGTTVSLSQYLSFGAETPSRGLAAGGIFLQVGLEVLSTAPDRLGSITGHVLWLPQYTNRLMPYLGAGGGVGWLISKGTPACPTCEANSDWQPMVSGILGLGYVGGWADSGGESIKCLWFLEAESSRYLGSIDRGALLVRQGIRWSLF